jgi:hypothetical protein
VIILKELFIVARVDKDGNVTGFPVGGGSSTNPSFRVFDKYESAKRSSKYFSGSVVVKTSSFEIVK